MFTIKDTYDNSHYTLDDVYVLWRSTDHGDGIVVIDEELNVKIVPSNYPVNLVNKPKDKYYVINSVYIGDYLKFDINLYPTGDDNIWKLTFEVKIDEYGYSLRPNQYNLYHDVLLLETDANILASLVLKFTGIVPKLQEILKREIDIVKQKQLEYERKEKEFEEAVSNVLLHLNLSTKKSFRQQMSALMTNTACSLSKKDEYEVRKKFIMIGICEINGFGNLTLTGLGKKVIKEYYHDYNG